MKKIRFTSILPVLACCIFITSASAQVYDPADSIYYIANNSRGTTKINEYFRSFAAFSIAGNRYTTDNLKGRITIVNFWFEGCAPCISEFNALNKLYEKYKANKHFQFLSFTFDTEENAVRVTKKYKLPFEIICLSKQEIYPLLFNLGFPTTIITDQTGRITYMKCGGPNVEKVADRTIEELYTPEIDKLLSGQGL